MLLLKKMDNDVEKMLYLTIPVIPVSAPELGSAQKMNGSFPGPCPTLP